MSLRDEKERFNDKIREMVGQDGDFKYVDDLDVQVKSIFKQILNAATELDVEENGHISSELFLALGHLTKAVKYISEYTQDTWDSKNIEYALKNRSVTEEEIDFIKKNMK